jgi:hypothetical protein
MAAAMITVARKKSGTTDSLSDVVELIPTTLPTKSALVDESIGVFLNG